MDGSHLQVILNVSVDYPENVAVDWVNNKLYVVEASVNRIDMVDFDGNNRVTLIAENLGNPRGLALDPTVGYLFFSDWDTLNGEPGLERAYMDGTNRYGIIRSKLGWPAGITLDIDAKRVYWVDSRYDYIETTTYDGLHRKTVVHGGSLIPHPFGLSLFEHSVYYTDWTKMAIMKANKFTENNPQVLYSTANTPYGVAVIHPFRQPYINNPCGMGRGGCEQICVLSHRTDNGGLGYRCRCRMGYDLHPDGKRCVAVRKFLLFSSQLAVRGIPFNLSSQEDIILPVTGTPSFFVGVDFSAEDNSIFFSDTAKDIIFKQKIDGTEREVLAANRVEGVEDLAYDWISKNLYWTDPRYRSISVMKVGDKSRRAIIHNLNNPRSIVVHPIVGFIFWTDWYRPAKIMRSWCDGSHAQPIVNTTLGWPNGLAIDWSSMRLYWVDAFFDKIEHSTFDGQNRLSLDRITQISHPFGLTIYGGYAYFTDWRLGGIVRVRKTDGGEMTVIRRGISHIMHVKSFNADLQTGSNFCNRPSNPNGDCSHFCFPAPYSQRVCGCPYGMKLAPNQQSCVDDPSSEPPTLQCGSNSFSCSNGKCVPTSYQCDGVDDCYDNSDEANCGTNIYNCTGYEFKCANGHQCVNSYYRCDGVFDCNDRSDESGCHQEICSDNNAGCTHGCIQGPFGAQCTCPVGYQLSNDSKTCEDIDECDPPGLCSQHCFNERGSFRCHCQNGYTLEGDGRTCKATGSREAILLVASRNQIITDDIISQPNVVRSLVRDGRNIVAVDFDSVTDRVYWSDTTQDRIWSAHKNGSDRTVIFDSGVTVTESIAIDWVGRNLYWTDYILETVEVAKLDGSHRAVLISENVTNPRGLVLDPRNNFHLMFWTDWGRNPRIERASMDGKQRTTIITNKLYWPNGLTIDYPNNLLYFADAYLDFIDYCDYNGNNRKQVLASDLVLQHPHAITIFEDFVYWTDRYINRVIRANKWHGENQTVMLYNVAQPMGLVAMHPVRQPPGDNPCAVNPCTHICLLSAVGPRFYSCACPSGWVLTNDQLTCSRVDDPFLVVVRDSIIYGISLNPDEKSNDAMVPIAGLHNGYDVDFDDAEQMIYWVEHPGEIHRVKSDGTNRTEFAPAAILGSPVGLALDWMSQNLYYTNPSSQSIEVLRLKGEVQYRKTLITNNGTSTGAGSPVGIAVDPARGKMYWTDQGTESGIPAKVACADMDGSNSVVLFTNNLDHVEFITIDIKENKLYWAVTGTGVIERGDPNGSNRITVVNGLSHPWGVAVHGPYLYFTDRDFEVIERVDKATGSNRVVLRNNAPGLRVLKVHYRETSAGSSNGCSNNIGACEQLCLPRPGGLFSCACATGFRLNADNRTCAPYQSYVVISMLTAIKGFSLEGVDHSEAMVPVAGRGRNVLHVDVHMPSGFLYWCDFSSTVASQNGIRRIKPDGSGFRSIVTSGIGRNGIRGIAVDWAAGNLYFTNAFLTETYIEVVRLNTTFRRVLLKTQVDMPRHIVVDPKNRFLFWADYGQNPKIERAFLDGTNRTVLVTSGIITPRGLALDHRNGYIYWVDDSLDMIARVLQNGGETQIVRYGSRYPTPYGITVFENNIIWVDRNLKKVFQVSKEPENTDQPVVIRDNINMLRDVTIFDQRMQPCSAQELNNNPCLVSNGGCSHFCFALPGSQTRKCACAFGNLAVDGMTCVVSRDDYLIYTTESTVRSLWLDPDDHSLPFPVVNVAQTSVALDYDRLDNRVYFTQSSGAGQSKISYISLSSPTSPATVVASDLGAPDGIAYDWINKRIYYSDYVNQTINSMAVDGSQRTIIAHVPRPRAIMLDPCSGQKIERCSLTGTNREVIVSTAIYPFAMTVYGQHIFWTDWNTRSIYRANKHDGSDQRVMIQNLPSRPMDIHVLSNSKQQQCSSPCLQFNGGCSHICTPGPQGAECQCPSEGRWYLADNKYCIPDNGTRCQPGQFTCMNGHCIRATWKCDNDDDCGDGSDELERVCAERTCQPGHTKCQSTNICIPRSYLCDGDNDCGDMSDESVTHCATSTCTQNEFRCTNGRCIPAHWYCDGGTDCADGSDEPSTCTNRTCTPLEFTCVNNRPPQRKCIPQDWVCDGDADCSDAYDEHQNCTRRSCSSTEFTCSNGLCIRSAYRCDRRNDCGDGSDEQGCTYQACQQHQFTCQNGRCISQDFQCDGDNDCGDESDELPHLCHTPAPTCPPGKFRCDNGNCVLSSQVCDHSDDCNDNSDEKGCGINECTDPSVHHCDHECTDTPTSFVCTCRPGFRLMSDKKSCDDVDECSETPSVCSQICENTLGSYVCKCAPGFLREPDGHRCRQNSNISPYLIFSNRYYLRNLSTDGEAYSLILQGLSSIVALDFDRIDKRLYWIDVSRRVVERMFFNGTGREVVLNGVMHGEGLAVDWVGRKLYWVDSFLDCLQVSELDGRFVRKLAEHCVDANNTYCFENPRAIVVHPKFGYSDLDGRHRHTVYDGVLPHPFAITVFEDTVYWTDWNTRTVEKGNKYNGTGRQALVNTTHRPFDIHVLHPYRQPIVTNPCGMNNGGCSHLCLLKAGGRGYTCQCPDHFLTLQIGGVASCLPSCSSTQYRCADNERCIPIWWKCDGQLDCRDGSDEPSTCPVRHCRLGQFQCNDGNCTSSHFLCNSNHDCPDGSDEDTVLCATHQCESHQWQCSNKRCIPEAWQCDGENDCGDGSDEDPSHCSSRTCRPGQFKCRNGRCIPQSWKCDVDDDCGDNSDEPIDECSECRIC
ncbi:low-density lipoprotein receptor-related protein 2a isoform X1 [Tachysurus ichikawai]